MAEQDFSLQEARSFSLFYEKSHRSAFRYIYAMTGGPLQEVEDMTAETFYRAWKHRDQFKGTERAAHAWLLTIARNLVFDSHRRQKSHIEMEFQEEWFDNQIVSLQQSEVHLEEQERLRVLWGLMQAIPARQREILILRHMLGWKVKEIAQLLNTDENNVSVSLHRAIKQIQQHWPIGE